jgi:lysyl-tRNA synthetase class 2
MEEPFSELISSLPYSYDVKDNAAAIRGDYERYEGKEVSLAGRIVAVRASGKLIFLDLLDETGKIQCYVDFASMGEAKFSQIKSYNSGDIIGVLGSVFKTKAGEITVKVGDVALLAKALKQLPDKWHGLQDVELRYRKRFLDLIVNPEVRGIFRKRSNAIKSIRTFLDNLGFIEIETPVIQPLYGGADAEPFKTFVNTLGEEDYLRIANELYLKRLVIGGFNKVYEIYKAFRNEDIDTTHSPEFTMVELYQAYTDYNEMMELTESMLYNIAKGVCQSSRLKYGDLEVDFEPPFKRLSFVGSINQKLGVDILRLGDEELFKAAESHGIRFEKGKRNRAHAYEKLLETLVQPELTNPTFVIDFPRETSPLTRPKRGNPELVERFELYAAGMELVNAYSELNNPFIQKKNFELQEERALSGDKEAEPLDKDFVDAMEYGMPPTGGLGLGVDRLVMLLTNKQSIKEVIPFPMEKRQK